MTLQAEQLVQRAPHSDWAKEGLDEAWQALNDCLQDTELPSNLAEEAARGLAAVARACASFKVGLPSLATWGIKYTLETLVRIAGEGGETRSLLDLIVTLADACVGRHAGDLDCLAARASELLGMPGSRVSEDAITTLLASASCRSGNVAAAAAKAGFLPRLIRRAEQLLSDPTQPAPSCCAIMRAVGCVLSADPDAATAVLPHAILLARMVAAFVQSAASTAVSSFMPVPRAAGGSSLRLKICNDAVLLAAELLLVAEHAATSAAGSAPAAASPNITVDDAGRSAESAAASSPPDAAAETAGRTHSRVGAKRSRVLGDPADGGSGDETCGACAAPADRPPSPQPLAPSPKRKLLSVSKDTAEWSAAGDPDGCASISDLAAAGGGAVAEPADPMHTRSSTSAVASADLSSGSEAGACGPGAGDHVAAGVIAVADAAAAVHSAFAGVFDALAVYLVQHGATRDWSTLPVAATLLGHWCSSAGGNSLSQGDNAPATVTAAHRAAACDALSSLSNLRRHYFGAPFAAIAEDAADVHLWTLRHAFAGHMRLVRFAYAGARRVIRSSPSVGSAASPVPMLTAQQLLYAVEAVTEAPRSSQSGKPASAAAPAASGAVSVSPSGCASRCGLTAAAVCCMAGVLLHNSALESQESRALVLTTGVGELVDRLLEHSPPSVIYHSVLAGRYHLAPPPSLESPTGEQPQDAAAVVHALASAALRIASPSADLEARMINACHAESLVSAARSIAIALGQAADTAAVAESARHVLADGRVCAALLLIAGHAVRWQVLAATDAAAGLVLSSGSRDLTSARVMAAATYAMQPPENTSFGHLPDQVLTLVARAWPLLTVEGRAHVDAVLDNRRVMDIMMRDADSVAALRFHVALCCEPVDSDAAAPSAATAAEAGAGARGRSTGIAADAMLAAGDDGAAASEDSCTAAAAHAERSRRLSRAIRFWSLMEHIAEWFPEGDVWPDVTVGVTSLAEPLLHAASAVTVELPTQRLHPQVEARTRMLYDHVSLALRLLHAALSPTDGLTAKTLSFRAFRFLLAPASHLKQFASESKALEVSAFRAAHELVDAVQRRDSRAERRSTFTRPTFGRRVDFWCFEDPEHVGKGKLSPSGGEGGVASSETSAGTGAGADAASEAQLDPTNWYAEIWRPVHNDDSADPPSRAQLRKYCTEGCAGARLVLHFLATAADVAQPRQSRTEGNQSEAAAAVPGGQAVAIAEASTLISMEQATRAAQSRQNCRLMSQLLPALMSFPEHFWGGVSMHVYLEKAQAAADAVAAVVIKQCERRDVVEGLLPVLIMAATLPLSSVEGTTVGHASESMQASALHACTAALMHHGSDSLAIVRMAAKLAATILASHAATAAGAHAALLVALQSAGLLPLLFSAAQENAHDPQLALQLAQVIVRLGSSPFGAALLGHAGAVPWLAEALFAAEDITFSAASGDHASQDELLHALVDAARAVTLGHLQVELMASGTMGSLMRLTVLRHSSRRPKLGPTGVMARASLAVIGSSIASQSAEGHSHLAAVHALRLAAAARAATWRRRRHAVFARETR